ncbi:MAG: PAS domain-containing protein [Planctomycetes bacterium]|nr:PAS domain-containing protein [Planctomycetota bacterium]
MSPKKQKDNQARLPTDIILDSVADGVFTVDSEWRTTSFNRAAEEITGVSRKDAIGRPCCEVFRAEICEGECALRQAIETGKPVINKTVHILDVEGNRVPISVSAAALKDARGKTIGGVETFRDLSVVEELRKELASKHTFQDIISKNHLLRQIFDILPRIAESDSTVLIEGPSGSGKELFARAIHHLGPRRDGPLVTVNCGALPDSLLESELFGHVQGAFTDAKRDRIGRFALAEGGTLFLDEIGDISPALQVRLLRVLQEKKYEPLGSSETVEADVRIVAATNHSLEELVSEGRFREDLYYRVNVVNITLPPLSQRKEDIPLLVDHFITRLKRLRGKEVTGISPEALTILMNHDFPGNVRELENAIEHAFVLCGEGTLLPEHLPEKLRPRVPLPIVGAKLDDLEANFIVQALTHNNWNRKKTAQDLGIHKTTLWRKMKRLGIKNPGSPTK